MSEAKALADLARSSLSVADAQAAQMDYADSARSVVMSMPDVPCIVIPYLGTDGQPMTYGTPPRPFVRVRYLEQVLDRDGKLIRYGQPARSGCKAYFPQCVPWAQVVPDVSWPIVITEGEKKALSAALRSLAVIGIGGVWNWRDSEKQELNPELAAIPWEGRQVVICYDSDAVSNAQVRVAELTLAAELMSRGADVRIARLTPGPDGKKRGMDDYIVAGAFDELVSKLSTATVPETLDQEIMKLNEQVAYLEGEDMVHVLADDRTVSKSSFVVGSRFSSLTVESARTVKGKTVISRAPLAPLWLRHPAARRYAGTVFEPFTNEREIATKAGVLLNRWRGFTAEAGDVAPWLELTKFLMSNVGPDVAELVINLLAYKAQNPWVKTPLATVLIGTQGCGKSLWAKAVMQAFQPYGSSIPSAALKADFQEWAETSLIVVIDEAQSAHTIGAKDQLKGFISEQQMRLNKKHITAQQVKNYSQFILTSNDRRVGSYDHDDRRMIVVDCPPPREKAFYDRVVHWLEHGGKAALMHFLMTYPLNGWKPPQGAPMTREKRMATREARTYVQQVAHDMRTADDNIVRQWLDTAMAWADAAEHSGQASDSKLAREIRGTLSTLTIRPWYTSDELAHMFPALIGQLYGNRKMDATPSGEISRQLRNEGIPFLHNLDNVDGFMWRGRMSQFLVIAGHGDYDKPIHQGDFDRMMDEWPKWSKPKSARDLQRA